MARNAAAGDGGGTGSGPAGPGDRLPVRVHRERLVNAPPARVFEVIADAAVLPVWNACMEARDVQGSFDTQGSTFDATIELLGMRFAGHGSVVAVERGHLVALRVACTEHGGTSEWTYRLAGIDGSTRCSLDVACEESGTLVVLDHMFGRPALEAAVERAAGRLLDNLAAVAELVPQPA